MSHFNVDPQLSSVTSFCLPLPLIPNGKYRIRSKNSNTYLDCTNNGLVTMKQSNHGASQEVGRSLFINLAPIYSRFTQWTISPASDGDYEIRPIRSPGGVLSVNNQNHLVCNTSNRFTWNIDPRGPDAYMFVSLLICISFDWRMKQNWCCL